VVRVVTEDAAGAYARGMSLYSRGEMRAAILAFRDAARGAHTGGHPKIHGDAVQSVVTLVARNVEQGGAPYFPREAVEEPAARAGPVSIVVCSIRPDRLAAMERNYRDALGAREHEFIAIRDALSLCEGYNRGLAQARHGIVVFSHDDVALLSHSPFEAIERALAGNDIVGFAGTTKVGGPAVMWSGHPYLRGFVAMPASDPHACKAALYSLECGTMGGMQALDGFCFAARREAALAVGFDAATFDGFHFYDLDFTYRAGVLGLRLAVTTDVVALHMSEGNFAEDWKRYAQRFGEKFPGLRGVRGSNEHYTARLSSPGNALRFYEDIRGLAATASPPA
jgi:hypothetical protein